MKHGCERQKEEEGGAVERRGAMGGLWGGGWRHLVDLSVCATEPERGGVAAFQDLNEKRARIPEINRQRMDIKS